MLEAFIIFSASFLVLSGLLLHKIWEMRRGETFIGRTIRPTGDSLIREQIDIHTEVIVGGSKRGAKAISSITKESTKHFFMVAVHYLHDKLSQIIEKMRSKGHKNTNGVSFFLKRMEERKIESEAETALVRKRKIFRLKVREEKPKGKEEENKKIPSI